MEAFKDSAHACTLLDYGIHGNRVHMVLERYPTSLRAWRAAHGRLGAGQVRLYLNTFRKVVQACCELLHANDTVHYDLKADNVLLQPDAGVDASFRPSCEAALRALRRDDAAATLMCVLEAFATEALAARFRLRRPLVAFFL